VSASSPLEGVKEMLTALVLVTVVTYFAESPSTA